MWPQWSIINKEFHDRKSTFYGQNDSGIALDIADSSLTIIVNSSLFPNRSGNCMDISDANIKSNISVQITRAILVSNSNISIIKCNFSENSAEIGEAIIHPRLQ